MDPRLHAKILGNHPIGFVDVDGGSQYHFAESRLASGIRIIAIPRLCEPIKLNSLELSNRIVVAPMQRYSAIDGAMTDWHSHHLSSYAISGGGRCSFGTSLAGGVITYGAATLVLAPVLLYPRFIARVYSINLTTAKWFTLSGFVVCTSQILRFMFLTIAPVAVVAPNQQTTTIWRVISGWFSNMDYEDISFLVLAGNAVSLLGALTLIFGVEFVLAHVPLPDLLISIARWQWP